MADPSGSSGGEASIVAEIVEVEENSTSQKMQTVRIPPIVTVSKSAAYAVYEISYIRDVPYRPVGICERLRDEEGHIIEHTQPTCCPCGTNRRVPSSCGNIFDKAMKGKPNTAHCLRFPGDWYQVASIWAATVDTTLFTQGQLVVLERPSLMGSHHCPCHMIGRLLYLKHLLQKFIFFFCCNIVMNSK